MNRLLGYMLFAFVSTWCQLAVAQTNYERIEVCTVLKGGPSGGIALGTFGKPLPLPDGEWLAVYKSDKQIPYTNGTGSYQVVNLTLKRNAGEGLIFAIALTFSPGPVTWNNRKCESWTPSILVDDLNTKSTDRTYLCVSAQAQSKFLERQSLASSQTQSSVRFS
jgi:hypothetical protein